MLLSYCLGAALWEVYEMSQDLDQLYHEGVQAIRAGDRAAGREKLLEVVRRNELHEQAWLWLSEVALTDEERAICLQNVLILNPASRAARRGLARLGMEAPPLAPASPPSEAKGAAPGLLGHSAAEAVGSDLDALLTGTRPAAQQGARSADPAQPPFELVPEQFISTATLTPPLEPPRRASLSDLARAWGEMLLFHTGSALAGVIRDGDLGHVGVSLAVAVVLQVLAGLALLLPLVLGGNLEAYLSPLAGVLEGLADVQPDYSGGGAVGVLFSLLGGSAHIARLLTALGGFGGDLRQWAAGAGRSPGLILLVYALGVAILLPPAQWARCALVNSLARYLNGRGDLFATMQALSVALIAVHVVQVPVALLAPFLPVAFLVWAVVLLQFYRLAVSAAALRQAHGLGFLVALGVLIVGGMILAAAATLLLALPSRLSTP